MKPLLALKASAGSGKTTRLVGRYLELLANGASPNEILCLTFTNKAAVEMKERVLTALQSPKVSLQKLGITLKDSDEIKLKSMQTAINSAPILTFDGFFNRILRAFCFYAGVPLNYEISGEHLDVRDFLEFFSESERFKIAKFLQDYNLSTDALMQNFSELYELPDILNKKTQSFSENTIMQIAFRIKQEVLAAGGANAKKAVDFNNVVQLLEKGKTWLCKDSLNDYSYFANICFSDNTTQDFHELKSVLRQRFIAREEYFLAKTAKWFDMYVAARKARLTKKGICEHADVTRSVWQLLRGEISSDFLYFRLDGKITHILIDEFQDTNRLQYDILKPLIDEITSGEGRKNGRTFFYVGDPKQSIYRFRGGVSALFSELADSISGLGVEELDSSYRLFSKNLDFVNKTFYPLFKNYAIQKTGDAQKQQGGYVEVLSNENVVEGVVERVKFLLANNAKSSQIAILCFKNNECEQIADALADSNITAKREATAKLVKQRFAKAIIEWLKFCFLGSNLCAANAYKLFGVQVTAKPQPQNYPPYMPAYEAIFNVMQRFEAYSEDAFALLERSNNYNNILDFVYNIEKDDTIFNVQNENGVSVLTVHKSKGLEFDYVILADKIGATSNLDGLTFTEFEGAKPVKIWKKEKMREEFDKDYAIAKRQRQQDLREDEINALYVACTRGKKALIIISKPQKSAFEVLNLAPLKDGEIIATNTQEATKFIFRKQEIPDFGRQETQKIKQEPKKAIDLGIAVHTAMEFFSNNTGELHAIVSHKINDENVTSKAISLASTMQGHLDKLLCENANIFKECAFYLNGKIGRMDLLILKKDGALIIDYKSGHTKNEAYEKQLDFYAFAIKKLLNIDAKTAILREDGIYYL